MGYTDQELQEMMDDWDNLAPFEQSRIRRIVLARNRKRSAPGYDPTKDPGLAHEREQDRWEDDFEADTVSTFDAPGSAALEEPYTLSPGPSDYLGAYEDEGSIIHITR